MVEILSVAPLYRCFFEEDNTHMDITANETLMEAAVEHIEPGGWTNYKKYMNIATSFLNFGLPNVIEERFDLKHLVPFIGACISAFPLFPHTWMLKNLFASPKIRAALSFQDLYIGLAPSEAPSVFSLLQALELNQGVHYPRGGFQSITNALERIAIESGVQLLTNHSVQQLYVQDDQVIAMQVSNLNGVSNFTADLILLNQDAPEADQSLVPPSSQEHSLVKSRPSCGVVSLSFGLNVTLSPLSHHSIFFSQEYEDSWNTVSQPDNAEFNASAFNFYVHAPSRTDSSCCPQGHDAITILVPVPPIRIDDTIAYDIKEIREAVLSRLERVKGMPDKLKEHIIEESIKDPIWWKNQFGLYRGSAFGLAHSLPQLSAFRPRFQHRRLRNVFRVGASTRPGNGVPLVMVGARLSTDSILKKLQESN